MYIRNLLGCLAEEYLQPKKVIWASAVISLVGGGAYLSTAWDARAIAVSSFVGDMRDEAMVRREWTVAEVEGRLQQAVAIGAMPGYKVAQSGVQDDRLTIYTLTNNQRLVEDELLIYTERLGSKTIVQSVNTITQRLVNGTLQGSPEILADYAISKARWWEIYRKYAAKLAACTVVLGFCMSMVSQALDASEKIVGRRLFPRDIPLDFGR